ncbi:MAG: alanine racemase [Candidatus Latescibacteria bacterium]|nr:alanine racemase [bacterium]MBD3423399.1 alanine racemase [Candidatus Latescibacterota bacterium]
MYYTSHIEIKKSALRNNLDFIRDYVGPGIKISSVVKGNAYGHGLTEFIPLAEECGVDHFSVFSAWEALEALKVTDSSTIMIMGFLDNAELEWALENDIEFYVFSLRRLERVAELAARMKKKSRLHIDIETGMNRTGFKESDLDEVKKIILENREWIDLRGLCTHYSGAESVANHVRVRNQYENYIRIYRDFVKSSIRPEYRHTASSAAAVCYPETRMDMIRVGILQYGFWPSMETYIYYLTHNEVKTNPLKRVLCWKSRVMDIKSVKRGEFIGYNTSFLAPNDMRIATIPVGYSDGYSRSLSNHGRVLINGCRASVIGLVSMNMLIADISEVPRTRRGDEVVLIGTQKNRTISINAFSNFTTHDINYELLVRLSPHIPRFVRA